MTKSLCVHRVTNSKAVILEGYPMRIRGRGRFGPGGEFAALRMGAKLLVDASPGPIAGATCHSPELSRARSIGVTRPWLKGLGEGRAGQGRTEGRELEPGTCSVRCKKTGLSSRWRYRNCRWIV